jgi:glycosyltransferase involved in cell wall biosynthesis
MKIAICHEHIFDGDAVGNDILGMARVLIELGIETCLIGENITDSITSSFSVIKEFDNLNLYQFKILIYHHSVYWERGAKLLKNFSGNVIFRYHNITPEHFFKPYSEIHYLHCMKGRMQTLEFASHFPNATWLANSEYTRLELIDQSPQLINSKVLPPFHNHAFTPKKRSCKNQKAPSILFVGRIAPNKGHKSLVRIFNEYWKRYNDQANLVIIGGTDPNLAEYHNEIIELINELGISSQIHWKKNLSDIELKKCYLNSDIFLCVSEHEGFCLPLVESQSTGLPVVSTKTSAIDETLGPDQLTEIYPTRKVDYLFYAKILNEIMISPVLRDQVVASGYKNFIKRFDLEIISDSFVEIIALILFKE